MERKAFYQDRPARSDAVRLPPVLEKIPFPVSPIIHSSLRAIYAGGPKSRWSSDAHGHPYYPYETRAGNITFFYEPPPDYSHRFHPTIALYYTPRLDFIYSGRLRNTVRSLSVESADVLMILMSAIARLDDPRTGIARITPEEIAAMRNIRLRRGRAGNLLDDLKAEVLRLADLRVSMTWKDYRTGGTVTFGRERPDRLLDLLDVEYRRKDRAGTAFRFRCGQALAHFLNVEGLFWIGYYGKALLHLNPYQEAFTKKLGTYWTLIGTVAGKKGGLPRATPRSILDFCGESVNWRNPGHTVDAFFKAHERLMQIGIVEADDLREPVSRTKGYMAEWLETPITVKLSEKLWRTAKRVAAKRKRKPIVTIGKLKKPHGDDSIPADTSLLTTEPARLKRLRTRLHLRQEDVAGGAGITRQTLSRYERGLSRVPEFRAEKILALLRRTAAQMESP
ncbi:MAG: helix-turn-helix transcriptional regulator [Syntrophaceae bacterium]|nr:helix-turn-helix transcriptional regulator [Syntrophaceae bacterium]